MALHLPGKSDLHIVLPRTSYTKMRGGSAVLVFVTPPPSAARRLDPTATQQHPSQHPDQHAVQWAPIVKYLISWVNDVRVGWVDQFLRVVHQQQMWDEVSTFFEGRPGYHMTHSGPLYSAPFPGPGPLDSTP